jgi:hypothetical protein
MPISTTKRKNKVICIFFFTKKKLHRIRHSNKRSSNFVRQGTHMAPSNPTSWLLSTGSSNNQITIQNFRVSVKYYTQQEHLLNQTEKFRNRNKNTSYCLSDNRLPRALFKAPGAFHALPATVGSTAFKTPPRTYEERKTPLLKNVIN